jgi:hypothetical protein
MRFLVLWCMAAVDKKFREKEHAAAADADEDGEEDAASAQLNVPYKRYKANDGVQEMIVKKRQADYLDSFSPAAQLYYITSTFVDGTDGIANGIARHVLSYVGVRGDRERLEEERNGSKVSLPSFLFS